MTQNIKEYLSTASATEGQLLTVRQIYDQIIGERDKAVLPRTEAALVFGPGDIPGSSIDVDLLTLNSASVRQIAEGAAITNDGAAFTSSNLKPVKYGIGLRITSELMEDSKWNLMSYQLGVVGRRFAENENSLIITALDGAANTVSGGATLTTANITAAMQHLENADMEPTTFVFGVEVLNDIRNLDTFAEFNKAGDNEMLRSGFRGLIYGMKCYKASSNAGMTATSSYVFDRTQAYMIAEKRPVSVEGFDLPVHDLKAASVTQRIKVALMRSTACAKITTT